MYLGTAPSTSTPGVPNWRAPLPGRRGRKRSVTVESAPMDSPASVRRRVRTLGSLTIAFALLLPIGLPGLAPRAWASGVRVYHDVQYGTAGGTSLLLDVYLPTDGANHPAIVVVHSGGWSKGDKSDWAEQATYLAEQGYVAFVPNYRLAPRSLFPAAYQDLQTAVLWIRQNATRYSVIPTEIAAFGGSAGGNLAALLGTDGTGPLDQGSRVDAVVSWSGPMDMSAIGHLSRYLGRNYTQAVVQQASPITFVDGCDPPMFIANSTHEFVPLQQAVDMSNALKAVGVPEVFTAVDGSKHDLGYQKLVWPATLDFLTKYVGYMPSANCSQARAGGGGGGSKVIWIFAGALVLLAFGAVFVLQKNRARKVLGS